MTSQRVAEPIFLQKEIRRNNIGIDDVMNSLYYFIILFLLEYGNTVSVSRIESDVVNCVLLPKC
jgi:hypothetical protein